MTKYTVEPGKHDFKPNDQPLFVCGKFRCKFSFRLDLSMWYPINDPSYPHGSYNGWNKLGFGFTQGIFSNARRSCMVAEFPFQTLKHQHLISLYVNDPDGDWDSIDLMTVKAGIQYSGTLDWIKDKAVLYLQDDTNPTINKSVSMYLKRSKSLPTRAVGAWHGGKYPAHQERSFWGSAEYKRF